MNNGNIQNALGGAFLATPEMDGKIEGEDNILPPFAESPQAIFDKTLDESVLGEISKHAPKFQNLTGRFNPFEVERLRSSAGTWSVLIDRMITTFQDTCDHALALCNFWVQEDKELNKIQKVKEKKKVVKKAEGKTNMLVDGSREYQIEQARTEWREAVRLRNEAMSQWNEYVNAKRHIFHHLRDN